MTRQKKFYLPSKNKPLYDFQIIHYARKYKIPYFRGIYFRNYLPKNPREYETCIINLDLKENPGTHWICYIKRKSKIIYFDPLRNVSPPLELLIYFSNNTVYYNHQSKQVPGTVNCGHLCLQFLIYETKNKKIKCVNSYFQFTIMLSHRIVIWDHVSDIHTTIFPAIHLNPDKAYGIGLIQFSVFNSTFNITETNNKLYYFDNKIRYTFTKSDTYEPVLKVIPPGLYTFDTLVSIINELVPTSNLRIVRINDSGYYVLHTTDIHPVFTRPDSVLQVFGFPNNVSHLNHIRTDDPAFLALNTSLLQVQHNKRKRDIVHTDNTLKETTLETDHHRHRFSVQRQGDKAIIPYPNDIPTISNETSIEDLLTYYYVAPFAASFNRYKEVYINCPLITNSYKNNTHSSTSFVYVTSSKYIAFYLC